MKLKDINLQNLWEEEMGWNRAKSIDRLVNDCVEEAFWEKNAPKYSVKNNLCRNIPSLNDKILSLIIPDSAVWEIGSGSGNFTIPIASKAKSVLGIEASKAMIQSAKIETLGKGIKNIKFINSKWEDFQTEKETDIIISINSLYRIKNIESCLSKMNNLAKKRIIIARSLVRPKFFDVLKKLDIDYHECNDYILIPNILWKWGIYATVEYITQNCVIRYLSEIDIERDIPDYIVGESRQKVITEVKKRLKNDKGVFLYEYKAAFIVIHWDKCISE